MKPSDEEIIKGWKLSFTSGQIDAHKDPRQDKDWGCFGHLGCSCLDSKLHICSVCGSPTHPCPNDVSCNTGDCSICKEWFNAHMTRAQYQDWRVGRGLRNLTNIWYLTLKARSKAIKKNIKEGKEWNTQIPILSLRMLEDEERGVEKAG